MNHHFDDSVPNNHGKSQWNPWRIAIPGQVLSLRLLAAFGPCNASGGGVGVGVHRRGTSDRSRGLSDLLRGADDDQVGTYIGTLIYEVEPQR